MRIRIIIICSLLTINSTKAETKDPWRIIEGRRQYAAGEGWVIFSGKILEVQPQGVRIEGRYFKSYSEVRSGSREFFVADFPYQVAEEEIVGLSGADLVAKESGVYTYQTALGGSRTLRKLEYGSISGPPPPRVLTAAEIEFQTAMAKLTAESAAKKKAEADARTLAWQKQLAEKGDSYGQLCMGRRFLKGDGVEKDEAKGRALLQKAAAQGNKEAKSALEKLAAPKP